MDDDDDDVPTCPLCLEELDVTDRAVEACHCGYQVCLWCLHHIREQLNGRCPACRTPYQEQNFKYGEVNPEQAAKEAKERATAKKERERQQKIREIEKERARAAAVSQQKAKNNLKHARILQKNLVYVIGLSLTLAREEVIRRADMFGKFGRMMRVLVNRSHPFNTDAPGGPSISAYVQYVRDSDATAAVRAMNNAVFDGREIRCAIATTKYCDAFVRTAAAADPNAAHFCGNHNCMYYHSLSQDPTLTREEVLARQLGPPPPAHLFLPADTRRPPPQLMHHRLVPPHPSPPPLPGTRPLPSRPPINSMPPPPGASSSAPAIHPPSITLPNVSAPIINPQPTSVPSNNLASSPLPSPPHPRPQPIGRKPIPPSSPHRTPPASPPPMRRSVPPIARSPPSQEGGPSHRPPFSSMPLASSSTGHATASAPVPSTAGWGGSQPGRSTSRSPPRRGPSSSMDDPSRPRVRVQLRRSRDNAPPGFEAPGSPPKPPMPSRPPGFDAPAHRTAASEARSEVAKRENGRPSTASVAPPGFGPGPGPQKDISKETTNHVAAAWSQEASSDQVFSAKARRLRAGTVGQVGTRAPPVAQDDPNARSELAQVLAKIGGDLGVSSEFQSVQTSAPFSSLGGRSTVPTTMARAPRISQPGRTGKPGPLDSLFGNPQSQTPSPPTSDHQRNSSPTGMLAGDPIGQNSKTQSFGTAFVPPLGRGAAAVPARAEASIPSRRSNSRFGFAREDPPAQPKAPPQRATPVSAQTVVQPTERITNRADLPGRSLPFRPNGATPNESSSPLMNELNELNEAAHAAAAAPPRQPRSRFDFADHGSSPPKAPHAPRSNRNVSAVHPVVTPNGQRTNPRSKAPVSDVFHASFAQLSTEEKLQSLFNSAQWAAEPLPPMPSFEPQVDPAVHSNATVRPSQASMTGISNPARAPPPVAHPPVGRQISASEDNSHPASVNRSRPIHFAPPGFREATPGTSPETTAVDKPSATTGVAATVASGGVVSTTTNAENSNTPNPIDESLSSGAESLEEDRKRNRAQRKRDKKARQVKESVGRKPTDGRDTSSQPAQPVQVTQPVQTVQVAQLPQPTHSRKVSQPAPSAQHLQPAAPDKAVQPVQPVGNPNVEPASTAGEQNAYSKQTATSIDVRDLKREAPTHVPNASKAEAPLVVVPTRASDEHGKYMSVSELEREVEAARAREAQLQDKLVELQRRIRSYDNVRT